ncbi:unnamed protein product [Nippostrongylus brasiliensis]|uniref:Transmembrane protein n=1 Tax=Nippostrongylus brasiliensis TaxID=27835 RepID=A0A0N4XXG0_NIPBR|nr:unnamed protein product [Nippostrongylus brasiliensis]
MFKTILQVHPSSSSNIRSQEQDVKDKDDDDVKSYRPTPLSSTETLGIVAFLSAFSFVYLAYAQHHKVLFYTMTSLIALWIFFIYAAGIFCVLYMVVVGHPEVPRSSDDPERKDDDGQQQESHL